MIDGLLRKAIEETLIIEGAAGPLVLHGLDCIVDGAGTMYDMWGRRPEYRRLEPSTSKVGPYAREDDLRF